MNWDASKASVLREYLRTQSGEAMLQTLRDQADEVEAGDTFETAALAFKESIGMRNQVKNILKLAEYRDTQARDSEFVDINIGNSH